MNDGIWIQNSEGIIIYGNPTFKILCKQDHIIGKTAHSIGMDLTRTSIELIMNQKKSCEKEIQIQNTSYLCELIPLEAEKDVIIGIVRNQSYFNKIKQMIQLQLTKVILDTIPHNIYFKNLKSEYILANKALMDAYHITDISDIYGKTDFELNSVYESAKRQIESDQVVISQQKEIQTELVIQTNNQANYYEGVKAPVFDENGQLFGIIGSSRDVTLKKRYEEKLKYLSYTDILTGTYNRTSFEEKWISFVETDQFPIGIIMGDIDGLKLINDGFGHIEGDNYIKYIANILLTTCEPEGQVFRWGGDEFIILLPHASESLCQDVIRQITLKCKKGNHTLIEPSLSLGWKLHQDKEKPVSYSIQHAESMVYKSKLINQDNLIKRMLNSIQSQVVSRSKIAKEDQIRIEQYSLQIGKELGLRTDQLNILTLVAIYHDIGNILIEESILQKKNPLTDEEYSQVKQHTERGYRIIHATKTLENVAKGVLHHHERYDGLGYPLGLKGEEIPKVSRIFAIVDSYVAMTSQRPYKKIKTHEEAVVELQQERGKQFDPALVDAFLNVLNTQ